ncbi:MAG: class I SAM-dependent RNA methyltransferase [Candidatus Nanosyncoccaceae bacterium]|jgi:23S rRNA (uracil1939-C5)-methyltransferase
MSSFKARLDKFVPGGQAITNVKLEDGVEKKAFIWGGLPGEEVEFVVTKKRAGIYEGVVENVLTKSDFRVKPKDEESYLSTSPWQILDWQYELKTKAELTQQVFAQHKITIPLPEVMTDNQEYKYRNKMEFTWWWNKDSEQIDLAHYRRGTKGKIPVTGSSLAAPGINAAARRVCDLLNELNVEARQLKTLLIRANRLGEIVAQLYVVDDSLSILEEDFKRLRLAGFEIIYSEPKSPASVITTRLQSFGQTSLEDEILGQKFTYPAESFFQINLPVYELALREIKKHLLPNSPIVDLYSGVGTIGLSVADGRQVSLVEISPTAVEEMNNNIIEQKIKNAFAVLSPAESAIDYITSDCQLIVDPPRAGLHKDVVARILEVKPQRLIYLSCNPATQARDITLLFNDYVLQEAKVFNFFPKTPHIEALAVLNLK